ncbi:MAG: cysteine desulfurase family protein [bacterium]|nr:cysteine desulfurase family protein [bacterium]MDZ4296207.1 cysteine desulfurase family protein [Patescibacteria group bacterium]
MSARIYLDYAATTPCAAEVVEAMEPYWNKTYGNASSVHWFGQSAVRAIDRSRETLARFLGALPGEIYFTGSATEADNLAVYGAVLGVKKAWPHAFGRERPHVIVSAIEHEAVLEPCRRIQESGCAEVTYLRVGPEGVVNAGELRGALKPATVLVSIMYANSEIGTIQPVAEIGRLIREENELRAKAYQRARSRGERTPGSVSHVPIRFHSDAVQAAQFLDCNVEQCSLDLATLSAHKIYGPKGVGALYIRRGTPMAALVLGGGQERGLRSGTENVPAIVGFSRAVELVAERRGASARQIGALRDHLVDRVLGEIPGTALNGARIPRLPNNANIRFAGVEGEVLLVALDQEGVAVSTGSACASRSLTPSHVLAALGVDTRRSGSLRFTLGRATTRGEIDATVAILKEAVEKLRKTRI